jgi:hypothetical protein
MNKTRFLDKYLIGSVTIICGILLIIITYGKPFKEVEDSIVVGYIFVFGGIIYILFKRYRNGRP